MTFHYKNEFSLANGKSTFYLIFTCMQIQYLREKIDCKWTNGH